MRKDIIRHELTLEWIVGTFMFIVLLALAYFTIIIGSDNLFRRTYPLKVYFEDVAGLREGDNVTVHGMAIGKVNNLTLDNDWVRVECSLDRILEIREDYRMEVLETSVLGGRQLRIDLGSPDAPRLPGDVRLIGEPPIDLMAEAGKMISEIRYALTEGGVLDQLTEGTARLNRVAGRLDRGEGTVGALLTDDTVYRDLTGITANLNDFSARVNDMIAAIERGEGTLGMLLKNDGIGRELDDILGNINGIAARLRAGEGSLGRLLSDDAIADDLESVLSDVSAVTKSLRAGRGSLGKLLADDAALYDDLAQTMAALRKVAQSVEAGEGSLGKLMTDDALYRQVTALINEVRATVDDFRESSPLTTFSSILFGAF